MIIETGPAPNIQMPLTFAIKKLQDKVAEVYYARGYTKASVQTLLVGVMEEVGELAQTVLVHHTMDYTLSPRKAALVPNDNVAHEVGDIIVYLLAICNKLYITPEFDLGDTQ